MTVFATNGRDKGSNVSEVNYAEEDGKCMVSLLRYTLLDISVELYIVQFQGLQEI